MNSAATMEAGTRLEDFLREHTTTDISKTLMALARACTVIGRMVNNAGLSDILGVTGTTNVQGESQQKLDDLSNQISDGLPHPNRNLRGLSVRRK
jgi:fructose-1,6-bisphosphatase